MVGTAGANQTCIVRLPNVDMHLGHPCPPVGALRYDCDMTFAICGGAVKR